MSKEKRRVPKLRFPGFTEDWEQRKLRKCVDISTGYPFDSQDFNENGEYLVITNGNIQENTPFVLNNVGNRIDLDDSLKKYILDIDDLLITMDGTVGRVAIVVNNKLVLAQRVCRIKSNEPYYIYQLLSKNNFIQSMNKIGHGGTIKHISLSEISEYQDFYPKSQKERIKISTVLTNCDKLITLHQRKLNNLKLKKKALLQKLFPKNGERYPEIRFSGFTDAWEQRKFSDITYLSGIKNKENKLYESYSISNEFGFIPQDEQFENGGTMKTADKSMYYIVSQNSFAYNPARINVGSIGYYDKPNNVIVSSLYEVFKTTDIVNDKFLWHWFKSNQFNRLIEKYQEGGVRLYFYYDKLCKGTIDLPTINEQNKISNLLDSLDLYITLHQRKLDHLQLQKKALLQQMFV